MLYEVITVIEAQKKDPEIKKLIELVRLQKDVKTNERDRRDPEYRNNFV